MSRDSDAFSRFIFEGSNLRGVYVHLTDCWRSLLERHTYPDAVRELLGEALAATTLLGATIKIDGSLTMQTRGDGPLKMLVVQATGARTVRGMASVREDADLDGVEPADFRTLVGEGHLAITIDPGTSADRYQGIVALEGQRLSHVLESYFATSEQLPTRLWLAASDEHAAGMLVQALPSEEPDEEAWEHAVTLADTVKPEELLTLRAETLLRRLFHAEQVRLFRPEKVRFYCRCSRSRVSAMLSAMAREELLETAETEGGVLSVSCDFCNARYAFDPVEIEQLYVEQAAVPESGSTH